MKSYHLLLAAALLFLIPRTLSAQTATPEANLAEAITQYNALSEYVAPFTEEKDVTPEVLRAVRERNARGIALLDKVIADGTAEQIAAARYFKANFRYKEAYVYGVKNDNAALDKALQGLTKDFEMLAAPSEFPMRYRQGEKNYSITFEDFAPTLQEYYTVRAELATALNRPDEALDYARRAYALDYAGADSYYQYLSLNTILNVLTSRDDYGPATADYAWNAVSAYGRLTEDQRKAAEAQGQLTPLKASVILKKTFERGGLLTQKGKYAGETARALEATHPTEALEFYKIAFDEKYGPAQEGALALARTQQDKPFALRIADRLADDAGLTNCPQLARVSDLYTEFGAAAEKIRATQEHLSRCREAELAKNRERRQSEARRENPFNVFLGIYTIPLITSVDKMDFGGHLDFRGKRGAISFGYVYVQERKDRFKGSKGDFHWDGFEAQLALKGFAKNSPLFTGILAAYAEKEFEEMTVLFQPTNGDPAVSRMVNAREQQYKLLWNFGAQSLRRIFGSEIALGLGASYNHFDPGVAEYANDAFTTGNKLLSNRKENSIHFQARFALSIGLNFGPKR